MVTTVLLVDDEAPFVETLSKRLAKRELKVLTALGGKQALDALDANKKVDVVILDVKMPEMDGIEALKEIKKRHPLVEVIMLTGHATVESAIEGMRLGAYDYLMKPCEMDVLIGKINAAKSKKRTHEEKIMEAEAFKISMRRGD